MTVKAKLEGHPFDLDALMELFRDGDPKVSKEKDGYYLSSAELEGLMGDGGRLIEVANRLLQRVTGVARILDSSFRPVSLPGTFVEDDGAGNGRRHHIVQAETVEARFNAKAVAVVMDGQSSVPRPAPPPEGPGFLRLAMSHTDVAEALTILGQFSVSLSWVDLYKLYEIVRDSVGSEQALKAKKWVPDAELSAFKASANRPDVSGSAARHARMGGGPPKLTMTLAAGEDFIRRLVAAWWNSLSGAP
ncbi:hypothetical protein [Streptomyces sp. CAI-85]|uniref:hypothetical protein n=1 Tax=Streptomyces sp. CAI-85 TaxID=1472662 RepID=UPI001586FAD3|nr:hypothetical protein [Streptomyces sp. CAI-85]NUV64874.1 hypothetical protein [Streptomyces sp. CAI-85]